LAWYLGIGALRIPPSVATVDAIKTGHALRGNLATERKNVVCVGTEYDVVVVDPALELAMLVRSPEGARYDVTVLAYLDGLERASRLVDVVGLDGPVAGDVGGWLQVLSG